jgi:signal peptidase II
MVAPHWLLNIGYGSFFGHSSLVLGDSDMPPTPASPDSPASPPLYRFPRRIIFLLALAAALLAGDLFLKHWAFANVHDIRTVIPNILDLRLTLNRGAVFGIGQGYVFVFVIITFIAVALIGYALLASRRRQWVFQLALMLVLAGALGNLHDRITLHAVRDMLLIFPDAHLPFGWHWPGGRTELYPWIFNLADVYLNIGIGTLILRSLFFAGRQRD